MEGIDEERRLESVIADDMAKLVQHADADSRARLQWPVFVVDSQYRTAVPGRRAKT
jgi:hypothetical protein